MLQAIKLEKLYAKGTIRISLGWENTYADAKKIAEELVKITSPKIQKECEEYYGDTV